MSGEETPWGRSTWRQPRKRVGGIILPMYAPPRRRWWPLWSALAGLVLFAVVLGGGGLLLEFLSGPSPVAGRAGEGLPPLAGAPRQGRR